jgi:hypothetical protein
LAKKGNKQLVAVDDQAGPECDGIASFPTVRGEGFEAIAIRSKTLYRMFWKP